MSNLKINKIVSLVLINTFLLLDAFGAGGLDHTAAIQSKYLSPAIRVNESLFIESFQSGTIVLKTDDSGRVARLLNPGRDERDVGIKIRPIPLDAAFNESFFSDDSALKTELDKVRRSAHTKNLIRHGIKKNDVVNSIRNNIAGGLAIALNVNSTPVNLDKWFEGTSDEIAARLLAGFNFEPDNAVETTAQVGLAYYLSGLDEYSKNVIKLKLEQLLRNAKRSIETDGLNALRIVVLFGQDKKDPFVSRKIMGYSGENTIYVHINTLLMAEIESEKEALGLMLKYQTGIIAGGEPSVKPAGYKKAAIQKLWLKRRFLTASQKTAEAARLKQQNIKKYSQGRWMSSFRLPGNLQDYLVRWTQRSRDLGKMYRDLVVLPWLNGLSWLSPDKLPLQPELEMGGFLTFPLRFPGYAAEQIQKTIKWVQEVEREGTSWGIEFEEVKSKPHSYRLLEFKRPQGYPLVEGKRVLIVNPNAGHDSTVGKDLVDTFLRKGYQVFAFDWQSADPDAPEMVSDLIKNVTDCINHIDGRIEVAAMCQGGWVTGSALSLLASFQPDKVAAAYMAAVPFSPATGENAITKTVQTLPKWFYEMLVFYFGTVGIQDGAHQMGGFESMGDTVQKLLGNWLDLIYNIDNKEEMLRSRGFIQWYYLSFLNLSLWYLEAVFMHFMNNDIFEGRYRAQVGHEMRTVDLSKIKIPLILLDGKRDDVTAPGVVLKKDLAELLEQDGVDIEEAWRFLTGNNFISDSEEGNANVEPGKKAVLENKTLTVGLRDFLSINDAFAVKTDPVVLTKILVHLKNKCLGQCRALRDVVGTARSQILEMIMDRGHIGVFSGGLKSESRMRWNESIDWVREIIAENDKRKAEQSERNSLADRQRIINNVQRAVVDKSVSALKQNLFSANRAIFVEQAI